MCLCLPLTGSYDIKINHRSGSAADTQAITDVVKYRLNFMEIDQGRPASVRDAAWAFKEIAYEYRDSLMAGLIGACQVWGTGR